VLVTQGGQLIRCPINDVRVAGRTTRGVRLFTVEADERVVSVTRIGEDEAGSDESGNGSEGVDPLDGAPAGDAGK
jgi:DNA gyrase subunit A